jgi:hypothetical protein
MNRTRARWPDSRWPRAPSRPVPGPTLCMRVWRPRPMNARSWSVCAATLPYRDVGYLNALGQLRLHKAGGFRETPVADVAGPGALRCEGIHKCRGRMDARERLKAPYRDGTTHVAALAYPALRGISASLHVIAKLAALTPKALAALAGQALACIEDPVVIPKTLRGAGSQEDTDPPGRKSRCDRNDPVAGLSGAATAGRIRAGLRNLIHRLKRCSAGIRGRMVPGRKTEIALKRLLTRLNR